MSVHQKKRTTDMLSNLLKEMTEIGTIIGSEIDLTVGYFITYDY